MYQELLTSLVLFWTPLMVLYLNSVHSQGIGKMCLWAAFERSSALEQSRAGSVASGTELWALTESKRLWRSWNALAVPMWGLRHLWLLLDGSSASPGKPELYWIYKHTWSGHNNLGNLVLLLIEFWGSVHSPHSPPHQSHWFYFRSLLISFHSLFSAKALPGSVCSVSMCSKGFSVMLGRF